MSLVKVTEALSAPEAGSLESEGEVKRATLNNAPAVMSMIFFICVSFDELDNNRRRSYFSKRTG
jgi:hypothetical protein